MAKTGAGKRTRRAPTKPERTATCYLCGKEGADTREHVVPRCLYPGNLPGDMITLPAHGVCNRLTSKDEEAFRNHVAGALAPNNPGYPLWAQTWKAIHRPEGAGMQRTFFRDMLSVPKRGSDGVVRPSPVVARLKRERADRVVAKIVKGLFTWKTGELLPCEAIMWRFGQAENGHDPLGVLSAFKVHNVLDVRWGRATDDPLATMWILGFHATAWFWASTMPKNHPTSVEPDAVAMTWRGP